MNDKFRVLTIKKSDGERREVYLLNPGDTFAGFGGSRHGLTADSSGRTLMSAPE